MTERGIELREKVRRNLAAQGTAGVAWTTALPSLLDRLEAEWAISVGEAFPNATEAFAAGAIATDGTQLALKVPIPGANKNGREMRILRAASGRGYARLIRWDAESGAMLLERLGWQLAALGYPIERQIAVICETLKPTWAMAAADLDLVTGAEKAAALEADILSVCAAFPSVCSERAMTIGLRFARARRDAFHPSRAVAGHGDAHAWNTLWDPVTGGFKFVDPDGLFIDPAHDLSISLREWSRELSADPVTLGRERCALLARLTGVDPDAIWQWGYVERLVNGLLYKRVGSDALAHEFISVAEAWAAAEAL